MDTFTKEWKGLVGWMVWSFVLEEIRSYYIVKAALELSYVAKASLKFVILNFLSQPPESQVYRHTRKEVFFILCVRMFCLFVCISDACLTLTEVSGLPGIRVMDGCVSMWLLEINPSSYIKISVLNNGTILQHLIGVFKKSCLTVYSLCSENKKYY